MIGKEPFKVRKDRPHGPHRGDVGDRHGGGGRQLVRGFAAPAHAGRNRQSQALRTRSALEHAIVSEVVAAGVADRRRAIVCRGVQAHHRTGRRRRARGLRRVSRSKGRPYGDVALGIGHLHLLPLSCEFLRAYPDIALRLLLSDRVLNPLENSIDVAVRIGPLADSSMIATRIGSIRVVACASPEYLEGRGRPKTREDLAITIASQSMRPASRAAGSLRGAIVKSRRPFGRG